MGTIFFIVAAIFVWSIAKSKSDENDDQRRLDDLRRRLRQQGSQPLDRPSERAAFEPGALRELGSESDSRSAAQAASPEPEGSAGNGRWSAWLDPENSGPSAGAESSSAPEGSQPLPSEPPSSAFAPEPESPPLERLRQGLGFPEPVQSEHAQSEPAGYGSEPSIEKTLGEVSEEAPDEAPAPTEPVIAPEPEPEPQPIPALSDGVEPADPDVALAERFERALEQREVAYSERGGPAPVELSISSSLVRPMGDLLSVLVNLAGGGAKHLTAQSRGLPVFGLRLAQPEELTEGRLVDALDHLERAHPTLRRGCAERLIGALAGVRHARPGWAKTLERLAGERD